VIRSNPSKIKSIAQTIICAASLFVLAPTALAQSRADLPMSTTESISINSSQRTQIDEFIQAWTGRALSDNAPDTKKAIETLTNPLTQRGVSVAFRQAYSQAITPLLNELDAKNTIGAKLASLRIAGALATPAAATRIKNAINDEDLGVQLFAVARAGYLFSATKAYGPAMTQTDAQSLIQAIKALAQDLNINGELLRACVRTLSKGTQLSSKDMGETRSHAIIALTDIVGARLRATKVTDDPSFAQGLALESASAITASISDISSDTTPQAVKAAVGLGGDIISIPLRRVVGGTIDPISDRDLTVRSVQAGETLLYFALRKDADLDHKFGKPVRQTHFAEQLRTGDDKTFRNQASLLLGPGSPIVEAFGFDDNRFLR